MSDMDLYTDEELVSRYNDLVKQYVDKSENVAKVLEDFGKVRNEIAVISEELKQRKIVPEDPQELIEKAEKIKEDIESNA